MAIILVETTCPLCGKTIELAVNDRDYFLWSHGIGLTQEVFPYLTPVEREMLITGICGECWEKLYPHEEAEDEAEDDWEESDDWPDWEEGWDEDMGFDPYLGCYSDDC